jgi:hypothetical protein
MASSIAAGFLKGLAGGAMDQISARQKAEQEMKKAKMLEQLRMETEKEMTLFKESRPDYQEELRGRKLTNDYTGVKMQQDQELFPLDKRAKEVSIANAVEDQAMAREKLGMERERLSLERASTGESIRASRSKNSGDGNSNDSKVLHADYSKVYDRMKDMGANPYELARTEYQWRNAVSQGKGTKWQKDFLSKLMDTYSKKVDPAKTALLPALDKSK